MPNKPSRGFRAWPPKVLNPRENESLLFSIPVTDHSDNVYPRLAKAMGVETLTNTFLKNDRLLILDTKTGTEPRM